MGLNSPIAGRVGKKHVSFRNLSGAPPLYPDLFRGLRPRTPTYFSLVGKVGKSTFKGGGCSDSLSPLKKPPTHNGFSRGLRPLAKGATPAHSGSTHRRAGHREIMRGIPKGGGRPPFASSWKRGSRGRNPIERVFPSVRFFGYFLSAQKVTRIRAGEAREPSNRMAAIRGKKFFSPARPAMGESERIGAMRWHRHGRKEAPT